MLCGAVSVFLSRPTRHSVANGDRPLRVDSGSPEPVTGHAALRKRTPDAVAASHRLQSPTATLGGHRKVAFQGRTAVRSRGCRSVAERSRCWQFVAPPSGAPRAAPGSVTPAAQGRAREPAAGRAAALPPACCSGCPCAARVWIRLELLSWRRRKLSFFKVV